jgi:hypothetical protein
MRRVLNMMWKEVLELRQDPRTMPLVLVAPIIQLTLLGYAATTDVTTTCRSSSSIRIGRRRAER